MSNNDNTHATYVSNKIIETIVNRIVVVPKNIKGKIRFSRMNGIEELKKVNVLRNKIYQQAAPYLLSPALFKEDRARDKNSFIYVIWLDNKILATIRLTPLEFESENFLTDKQLTQFLGDNYQNRYLEWGRLVVDPSFGIKNLMPAILIYAGMNVLSKTAYRYYFGYSTRLIYRSFKKFSIENEVIKFQIPERLNQEYILLKGDFLTDFNKLATSDFCL